MKQLTPRKAKAFVVDALKIGEIPYLSGAPGIGKSDIIAQVADEFNLKLLDIRLSQMLPEDLTGLPQIDPKTMKATYTPFDTFPMEGDSLPLDQDGDPMEGWLIFLDELSSATEEVMAAIYSLLLGHRVGGKKVHPKALIVGAGNRSEDSAIARPLPDTLITRMLPISMKVSSADWIRWAREPETNANETVIEFIEKYRDMLLGTVPADKREELETYATPRGWGKVFKIVNRHEKEAKASNKKPRDAAGIPIPEDQAPSGTPLTQASLNLMTAAVGSMAAVAFKEHYDETMQLPYPWDAAQSPGSTRIPGTTMGKASMTSSVADYFIESDEDTRDKLMQYMNRFDGEHRALFTQIISEKLGFTASDQRLVSDIKKRMKVDEIAIPEDKEEAPF